jgi:hypothetical protein
MPCKCSDAAIVTVAEAGHNAGKAAAEKVVLDKSARWP